MQQVPDLTFKEYTNLPSITRNEVMTRAKQWVDKKIPYCQCNGQKECCGNCPYCSSTRCDCSGYVSWSWGLSHGYTTQTLPEISHQITKEKLKPGDIMLYREEHVVLFGGWCDKSNTTFHAFQEPGCHTTGPHYAYESCVKYPMNWEPTKFLPFSYNHIQENNE